MQVNNSTGEVYAACESIAKDETIELQTICEHSYAVVCWDDIGELRWHKHFVGDLPGAIAEYNKWALVLENMPTFN